MKERDTLQISTGRYRQAVRKIRNWLIGHYHLDGSSTIDPDDLRYYYKLSYLCAMTGLHTLGGRVSRQVMRRFLQPDGSVDSKYPESPWMRYYGMGWLTLGGCAVERFDLAEALATHLQDAADLEAGGVFLDNDEKTEKIAEISCSSSVAMALSVTGRIAAGAALADRFILHLSGQPDPRRFYNRYRKDGSIITPSAPGPWSQIYDLSKDEAGPAGYATVVNALVWTARRTGKPRYFEAAQRYVNFVYSHDLNPAHFGRTTKFGWAMLNLYEDTGDTDLLMRSREIADVLVARQEEDGLWTPRPGGSSDDPLHARLSYSSDCAMTVCACARLPDNG